ncbi:MAG TPA: flavodoxin [Vicinamibacterales bacterium]|nr:flavodoxin [Vicinamibacterales bacterium]
MPRILVVYFSRTGHTRLVAAQVASALGADLEELVDPTNRTGILGYLRSGREAFFRRLAPIAPIAHDAADYDLVVVGTPIWNFSLSAPVRTYLQRYAGGMRAVAFFCTCGGGGMDRVFGQMAELTLRPPVARLVVREAELSTPRMSNEIERFVAEIRAHVPTNAAAPVARPA